MDKIVEENVKICGTFLGKENHGIPTCQLKLLSGECTGLTFGGYDLRHSLHTGFVQNILDTLNVDSWEQLPGTNMRIRMTKSSPKIISIGHIIKDRWFNPEESE